MSGFAFLAQTLWLLGYPEQALKSSDQSIALAHELSHPFSLAYSLTHAMRVHDLRREMPRTLEKINALLNLASQQDYTALLTRGTIYQGWLQVLQGEDENGIAQMRQGIATLQASGDESRRPHYLGQLAEAYGRAGQPEEGLVVLTEAVGCVDRTGERVHEADLYRLKGELLLQQSPDNHPEAEDSFQQSLDVARHQQAKSFELRAATSLARLWQQQDKYQEAYDLLAPVYNWFTEGFNTDDLQEVQALLAELGTKPGIHPIHR